MRAEYQHLARLSEPDHVAIERQHGALLPALALHVDFGVVGVHCQPRLIRPRKTCIARCIPLHWRSAVVTASKSVIPEIFGCRNLAALDQVSPQVVDTDIVILRDICKWEVSHAEFFPLVDEGRSTQ